MFIICPFCRGPNVEMPASSLTCYHHSVNFSSFTFLCRSRQRPFSSLLFYCNRILRVLYSFYQSCNVLFFLVLHIFRFPFLLNSSYVDWLLSLPSPPLLMSTPRASTFILKFFTAGSRAPCLYYVFSLECAVLSIVVVSPFVTSRAKK